jgi:hypothetical protein
MDNGIPRMKKGICLNDDLTITLPAHVWLQFYAAYLASDEHNYFADIVARTAYDSLIDPLFVKEMEAASQAAADKAHRHIHSLFGSELPGPEIPPGMEGN